MSIKKIFENTASKWSSLQVTPNSMYNTNDVNSILDKSEEEIDTITFGLETADDKIVKVYVSVEDADNFEKSLGELLGQEDYIEDLLDILAQEYDIIDVSWPEDYEECADCATEVTSDSETDSDSDESDEDKADEPVFADIFKMVNSISESSIDISENDDSDISMITTDPEAEQLLKRYGRNKYVKFAILIMLRMQIAPGQISIMLKRNPAMIKTFRETMTDLGASNRRRIATSFGIEDAINESGEDAAEAEISKEVDEDGNVVIVYDDIKLEFSSTEFEELQNGIQNEESEIKFYDNDDLPICCFRMVEDTWFMFTNNNEDGIELPEKLINAFKAEDSDEDRTTERAE